VTDAFNGGTPTTLGTATLSDSNPKAFTYSHTVSLPQFGCKSYPNIATFTTNNTGTTGTATQTVTACGPAKTSSLTMGFWKNTNGNGLIANYCNPTSSHSLGAYLRGLGTGSGPFSNAPSTCGTSGSTSTSNLVGYANTIFKAASASNMNAMLKAQMLATALNVYFSDPALGYTSTTVNKVKPPSTFLLNGPLGSFSMDMTAICPEVDNLSTGTATCSNNTPSTNAVSAGAVTSAAMTVQAILDYESTTTPSPFNGSTSSSAWYGTNRTLEEIAKNIFDQINNEQAFSA
jgi:hypothetical protein